MGRKSIIAAFGMAVAFLAGTIGVAVGANPAVEVRAEAGDTFSRVTEINQLVSGETYVITTAGSTYYYLSNTQASNNRTAYTFSDSTISGNKLTVGSTDDSDIAYLTLGGDSTEGWTFYDSDNDGYLSMKNNDNRLNTASSTSDPTTKWDISFDGNGSLLIENKCYTGRRIKKNSSGNMFAAYTTNQTNIALWEKTSITASEVFVVEETSTFDEGEILFEENFIVDVVKSDNSESTSEDYTVSIGTKTGDDYQVRTNVVFGKTAVLPADNNIRFTSVYPTSTSTDNYLYFDVAITVNELVLDSISIEGDMANKEYRPEEEWDFSGLVVIGNPAGIDITQNVVFTADPAVPVIGIDSVTVTAAYKNLETSILISDIKIVTSVLDVIDRSFTGVSANSGYAEWDSKIGTSGAVYAGQSAGGNDSIQLRATKPSGIVSTSSAGTIRSVRIEWNSNTVDRYLSIYASNTAFTGPDNLYDGATFIEKLSKTNGETYYEFQDDYKYVGIRSESGALYLDKVTFEWNVVEKEITVLSMTGDLAKKNYFDNESWDYTGLKVEASYSDGSKEDVTFKADFVWEDKTPVVGAQQVKVKAVFEGKETNELTFDVSVTHFLEPYVFKPSSDDFKSGTVTHDGVAWNFFCQGGALSNFDSNKGVHFGTGDIPCNSVDIFSNGFMPGSGATLISRLSVNASTASSNSGDVTLNVYVNRVLVGSTNISSTPSDYEFSLATPSHGSVEIEFVNGGGKAAMYFGGVQIYADTDDTGSVIIPIVRQLETIKTCNVTVNDETFGVLYNAYKDDVESFREVLSEIVIRDYASMDTAYEGGKVDAVNFFDKYNACLERYNGTVKTLGMFFGEGENDSLISIIAVGSLALITGFAGLYCLRRRRRA